MLTLNDGRNELWQWDTGRTLAVDADCSQVHFSNKVFGRSIDVDVIDGSAIIPDILLQTDKDLSVWAFVGTSENGYTKISKTFKVNRRNKPADYVFTPPEQTTLGEILKRLDEIEESQDPDAIKNAVDDYLAKNPIMVKETDPTVPEWAKYPTKPSYTAAEVGAQPAGNYLTEIEIKPVIEAANSAQALAKQADKKVDTLREVVSKFHSNIVEEAKGDIITLDDASDMELTGLTLYGNTKQNGTPTPEAPIPLESVGDEGSVAVTVCGKNLLDVSKFTNQYYTADGNVADRGDFKLFEDFIPVKAGDVLNLSAKYLGSGEEYLRWALFGTDKAFLSRENGSMKSETAVINISQDGYIRVFIPYVIYDADTLQLERNPTATAYEPYTAQTLTAQTPNGLPGIPVSSGGNYTDENGQRWICDEVDFARGKYVQRVGKVVFDGTETFTPSSTTGVYRYQLILADDASTSVKIYKAEQRFMCSHFQIPEKYYASADRDFGTACIYLSGSWYEVGFKLSGIDMATYAAEQYAAGNPVTLIYPINTIETDLTAEEIAQYSALHTNYPNTTVYNDEGAGMGVKYVADTKLYIDNKFTELQNAILSAGANV